MSAPIIRNCKQLIEALDKFATRLTNEESHLATQQLFKNLFFAWLFLHTALLVPFHREVWAPDALVQRAGFNSHSLYNWVFYLSGHRAVQSHYLIFVLGQLIVLALGIAGVAPRVMNLLACVITINLNNLTGVILDGGNNLSQLLLIYMIFLNTSGHPLRLRSIPVRMTMVAFSNAAFFLCRLQVVIVYVCTTIFKLNGPLWQSGMALYYILQGDSYTHPILYHLVLRHPWVSMLASYFTIAYQALFPTLVWFRRTRPYILIAGATIHLGISFGMGLFTFGLIMCVVYTLFFTNEFSQKILHFFSAHDRLRVAVNPDCVRLQALMRWLKRLDWFGALEFSAPEAGNGKEREQRGDAAPWRSLAVYDEAEHATWRGPYALWRVTGRLPLCLPLVPVLGLLGYLGAAPILYRYLERGISHRQVSARRAIHR